MSQIIENVPHFWVLAGVVLAAILIEAGVLFTARRTLRLSRTLQQRAEQGDWAPLAGLALPSRLPEIAAVLAPLGVACMGVAVVRASRAMIWQAVSAPSGEPEVLARLLSGGIAGDLHGTLVGAAALGLVLLLACFAVGLAVSARLRARGLAHASGLAEVAPDVAAVWARHPGPEPRLLIGSLAAFVVLGLGPVLQTIYASGLQRLRTFADLVGVDPSRKGATMDALLTEVGHRLATGLTIGRIGTLLAGAVIAALVLRRSPARARAQALGKPADLPGRGAWILAGGLAALAVALLILARPLQRENNTPWPPFSMGSDRLRLRVDTPELTGPDDIQRAPVLVAGAAGLSLNGARIELGRLEDTLWVLRDNFRQLRPGELFDRGLLFLCSRSAPAAQVVPALAAAAHAGYSRPRLTFLRPEETDRPLFGKRARIVASAVAFTAVATADEAEENTAVIDASGFTGCTDLSARLVEVRREGKDITLVVGRP